MSRSFWFATSALTLLVAPTLAGAQPAPAFTFGKAEETKDVKDTEWTATAEAGLVVTTGNSRTTTVTGGAKATRKQKENKFSAEASATFARASTTVITNTTTPTVLSADEVDRKSATSAEAYNVKLRYDRFLTEFNSLFVAALGGADIIAGKDFVGGGQLGYARLLFKSEKHEVAGEFGYDFSYENLADGTSNNIHSARAFVGYKGKLSADTSADASLEMLANVNKQTDTIGPFEDLRGTASAGISTKLSKGISLSVSITGKFDKAPAPFAAGAGVTLDPTNPPENSKLDTTTKASLIVNLF